MLPQEFTRRFPKVYHLTFASNLPSIQQHGLHSSASLADLYRFSPEERQACLGRRRLCIQDLHGISIRDQHTAPESKMKTCLVGITIPDWLALLNSKVFFSITYDRIERLLQSYRDYEHLLLEVDSDTLLARYAAHITLSRINMGAFIFVPRPRGRASFIPLNAYTYENKKNTPAELTVDVPIPDILQFATRTFIPARTVSATAANVSKLPSTTGV